MPAFVKHEEDWQKARKEADRQKITKKGDKYWKYVTSIYRKMHPEDFSKSASTMMPWTGTGFGTTGDGGFTQKSDPYKVNTKQPKSITSKFNGSTFKGTTEGLNSSVGVVKNTKVQDWFKKFDEKKNTPTYYKDLEKHWSNPDAYNFAMKGGPDLESDILRKSQENNDVLAVPEQEDSTNS